MQIYLARDGAEIGEYPREQIDNLARAGTLQPNDYYWHEGMPDWLLLSELLGPDGWKPLPSVPFYQHRLVVPVATGAAFLVAGAIAISLLDSGSSESRPKATLPNAASSAPTPASATEVRDQAAADLERRIHRLPARATPPLNLFYYDVAVDMRKSLANSTPWTATVRGGENIIDPATQQTTRRTQFTLTADYLDGEWTYRHYHATITDLSNSSTTEIVDDEDTPTPPSLVGMLGLKMKRP